MLGHVSDGLSMVLNKATIKIGFARTGLWPYDPQIVLQSKMLKENEFPMPDSSASGTRKRGPNISGRVLYDGMNQVLHGTRPNAENFDEKTDEQEDVIANDDNNIPI